MATYSNDKSWNRYTVSIGSLGTADDTPYYKIVTTVPEGAILQVGRVHATWSPDVHADDSWKLDWKRVEIDGTGTGGYTEAPFSTTGEGHGTNCHGAGNGTATENGSYANVHPLTRTEALTVVEVGGSGDELYIQYHSESGSMYLTGFWVEYWLYE